MDIFKLSRNFWDWSFENPELISTNHIAIFFFAIEHCNRLGGKEKFGFPSQMTMEAVGIKKHGTYINYFNDLCEWGFFKLVQKSSNQYSANIISLQYGIPKNGKSLDKAFVKHRVKQTQKQPESIGQSNGESNSTVDIQIYNNTNLQDNNIGDNEEISLEINLKNEVEGKEKSCAKKEKAETVNPLDLWFEKFNSNEKWSLLWNDWREYKKSEHKFYFKSRKSEKVSIEQLFELSNKNFETAEKIIKKAIANGHKGIYPLSKSEVAPDYKLKTLTDVEKVIQQHSNANNPNIELPNG